MWNKRLLDLKHGGIRPDFHPKTKQRPWSRRRFSSGPRLLFLFHLHYPLSLSQTWIRGAAARVSQRMPPNRTIGWLPINISQWIGWFWGPSFKTTIYKWFKHQTLGFATEKSSLSLLTWQFSGMSSDNQTWLAGQFTHLNPFDMIYPFKLPLMGDFPGNYVWLIENINPSSIQETNSHCNMISHSIPLALNPTYSDLWNFMSKIPDFYWGIGQRPKNGWFLEKPLRRPTHFL